MRVLNFGSLNVDHVYRVPRIARPGESMPCTEYRVFAGGKGANQSMALARAGAPVWHAGKVGRDTRWLIDRLAGAGVRTELIQVLDEPGGHAVIQVEDSGENSIVVYGGANQKIQQSDIDAALARFEPGEWFLLQNETNVTRELLQAGRRAGLRVVFNAAPAPKPGEELPLDCADYIVVNRNEAAALTGRDEEDAPEVLAAALAECAPDAVVVLSLGADGVLYRERDREFRVSAYKVGAVDTTGAGDTFIGFWLAGMVEGMPVEQALDFACRAAALAVSRMGAMDSIPDRAEVERFQ